MATDSSSCLGNPLDRRGCWVTESWTRLSMHMQAWPIQEQKDCVEHADVQDVTEEPGKFSSEQRLRTYCLLGTSLVC